jgi:glutathionylspermidine synthase
MPADTPSYLALGVAGLAPFPGIVREPARWQSLLGWMSERPFFSSEGLSTTLGPPHFVEGPLRARCEEVVARFDRFYREVIAAYHRHPALRADFGVNAKFARAIELDRETVMPLPLSRLDCVLCPDGQLRVIEINPIGVSTLHLQNAYYLTRSFARHGWPEEAKLLGGIYDTLIAAVERYVRACEPVAMSAAPLVALVTPKNMHRGSRAIWRKALAAIGWRGRSATADRIEVRTDGVYLDGERVDVLWTDTLVHLGYQYERYRHTKWPSRFGDYSSAPEMSLRLLGDERVLEHIRARRVVHLSPASAYLALSKQLLAWIHDADRPISERGWLAEHVARTYSARDRLAGRPSRDEAIARRSELVLKPCQYGGAHGVIVGTASAPSEWARRVEEVWADPDWVLQDYHEPGRAPNGEWLSIGLYNYGGRFGGMTIRSADDLVISARKSRFIVAIPR